MPAAKSRRLRTNHSTGVASWCNTRHSNAPVQNWMSFPGLWAQFLASVPIHSPTWYTSFFVLQSLCDGACGSLHLLQSLAQTQSHNHTVLWIIEIIPILETKNLSVWVERFAQCQMAQVGNSGPVFLIPSLSLFACHHCQSPFSVKGQVHGEEGS